MGLTYKSSGVDISKANAFLKAVKGAVQGTHNASVIRNDRSFGALFALDKFKMKDPVLVSSTDGVGTKLLIAQAVNRHDTVGIDLVAMNVNDILCAGAHPLFFLDYIACGKVRTKVLQSVMKGIADGCREARLSLIGGETAEMPGMYKPDEYDLAGFAVGIAERSNLIDGSGIRAGDLLFGLPSNGLHSNGFTLVRKALSMKEQKKMAHELLKPTRIYTREVLLLKEKFQIKGIMHITGGAFYEKIPKVLPKGLSFCVNKKWPIPKIFGLIQKRGKINDYEMYRTFNMGIGLAFVIGKRDEQSLNRFMRHHKIRYYKIGEVIRNKTKILFS